MHTYVAFLRGINVGGHHKVPMAELRKLLGQQGLHNVVTLLNSGNIIFAAESTKTRELQASLSSLLAENFGFEIPTIVYPATEMLALIDVNPFTDIEVRKDIRLYVSFIRNGQGLSVSLPWESPDGSYRILEKRNTIIMSVLDISKSNTPKAMEILEKSYGKDLTTRNWNTILRIGAKLGR